MKILIAVPTFETIYPDTFQSIYELDKDGHEVFFRFVRGYDCATARNNIAQMALDMGVDYVLMVDNDVVLPKETIKWMLDEPVDVCLGYYAHRGADNLYTGRVSICKLGWFNYPLESEYTADEMETYKKAWDNFNQSFTDGKEEILKLCTYNSLKMLHHRACVTSLIGSFRKRV